MRFKMIVVLMFATSLSVFASASLAQGTPNSPQQPVVQYGQRATGPVVVGGAAPPGASQTGNMMWRTPGVSGPGEANPLQQVSRLISAVDDPRVRAMLGLTDQQVDGLRKIIVDTETFTITTGAEIAVNSIQLRELLRADKPDRAAVKSKGDEISKSTSLMINHYLDAILAAKDILTPEQQKMIRDYVASGGPALAPPPPPRR